MENPGDKALILAEFPPPNYTIKFLGRGQFGSAYRIKGQNVDLVVKIMGKNEQNSREVRIYIELHKIIGTNLYGTPLPEHILKLFFPIMHSYKEISSSPFPKIIMAMTTYNLFPLSAVLDSPRLQGLSTVITVPFIRIIFKQILTGLFALHSQTPPIMHRDIKPENMVLHCEVQTSNLFQVTTGLIDFGLSTQTALAATHCGSLMWMAPEVLLSENK
jgi:serine/threonine protein kinase